MFSEPPIKRRKSTRINVGNVAIGDGAPIAVQSMTNTNTLDVDATVAQIKAIQDAGADIVRVSVPTMDAAEAFKSIKEQVDIPLVTDIHFDYRIALKVASTAPIVCVLTQVTLVAKSAFVRLLTLPVSKISRSELASMAAR